MRITYKSFPYHNRAFPGQRRVWRPVLTVKILYGHASSKKLEAIVDTGSDCCLFHSGVGEAIGIKLRDGLEGDLGAVIAGPSSRVYYHDVRLVVGTEVIEIKAGFSQALTFNLLGQAGFFENFAVTFDQSSHPPSFEIQRIYRQ